MKSPRRLMSSIPLLAGLIGAQPQAQAKESAPEPVRTRRPEERQSMTILRLGMTDGAVRDLQSRLKERGFPPGAIDGIFGPATEAAVMAWQRSQHLPPTGAVDEMTYREIYDLPPASGTDIVDLLTPELVARMFPLTPIDNIRKYLPIIIGAMASHGLACRAMLLMAFATIRAETESWEPIAEWQSRFNTSPGGKPFDLYDYRKDLGNRGPPDGWDYRGRGFVGLTGRWNYGHYGRLIGLEDELIVHPDRACEPEIAAQILAIFLKSKERELRTALMDGSLKTARRLINGGSHGLSRFVETYNRGQMLIAAYP